MIQVNDIRVGNYLKDRCGKIIRADFIEILQNGSTAKIIQNKGQESKIATEYSNHAEPIKLTPKWMKKFGFEKTDSFENYKKYEPKDRGVRNYYVCFYGNIISFGLSVLGAYNDLIFNNKNLQYVHQFQNLYYALTGVELTVKEE